MNAEQFNSRVKALTTGTKPKDRKDLVLCIGDNVEGTAAIIRKAGIMWALEVPVGECTVHAGSGRRIEVRPSWRHEDMLMLCIGENAGAEYRIRGSIEIPGDAELGLTEVVRCR